MPLNLALVIAGDETGAVRATTAATKGINAVSAAAREAVAPLANVAAEIDQSAAAAERESAAVARLNTTLAANAATRKQVASFNTANIAAQFQDIGVTAAMGMSPMQIALQQGTQLTAALGNQGLKGTVLALGGAFASMLNPVSLVTIAAVGLGAAAIQAFTGAQHAEEDTEVALKRHKDWLDKILAGYDGAKKAADSAAASAQKLPQGAVESDLGRDIQDKEAKLASIDKQADAVRAEVNDTIDLLTSMRGVSLQLGGGDTYYGPLLKQAEAIRDLALSSKSGAVEIAAATEAVSKLQGAADDPGVNDLAEHVRKLLGDLQSARAELVSSTAAMVNFNNEALQGAVTQAGKTAISAVDRIRQLAPELRDARQQATEELNKALGSGDAVLRDAAQSAFDKTIAALDEQDRRKKALADGRSGSKGVDQWGNSVENFQQRLDQAQLEIALTGKGTAEVEKQRSAFELLNDAKSAGVAITPKLTAQIDQMASAYAAVRVEQERINQEHERQADLLNIATSGAEGLAAALDDGKLELSEILSIAGSVAKQLVALPGSQQGTTAIGQWLSSLLGGGGNFIGGSAGAPPLQLGYQVGVHHGGGTVGAAGIPTRLVPASLFANAPRFHNGLPGLASDERAAILQTGEEVTPRGGSRGPTVNVTIVKGAKADSVTKRGNASGGVDLKVMVADAFSQNLASGRHDALLASAFGLTRRGA